MRCDVGFAAVQKLRCANSGARWAGVGPDQVVILRFRLRKPADRLGKVVFASEVSIGGVGGGGCPGAHKSRYWAVIRVVTWIF